MPNKVVCDTCALLYDALAPERLTTSALAAIEIAERADALYCSDISLWEIAMLIDKGRVCIDEKPLNFIETLLASRGYQVLPITPAIATLSQSGIFPHGDPADRLIGSTALDIDADLITSDSQLAKVSSLRVIWKN